MASWTEDQVKAGDALEDALVGHRVPAKAFGEAGPAQHRMVSIAKLSTESSNSQKENMLELPFQVHKETQRLYFTPKPGHTLGSRTASSEEVYSIARTRWLA